MLKLKISFAIESEFQDCQSIDLLINNIQEYCFKQWPSLKPIHKFLDDFDLAILENKFCYIGFSNYLDDKTEIWLIIKSTQLKSKITQNWFSKAINKFLCLEQNLV